MKTYFDKNGKVINVGDFIQYDNENEIHKIYACGDHELGINASNIAYLRNHPYASHQEFYPLPEHSHQYSVVIPTLDQINKLKEEMGEYF